MTSVNMRSLSNEYGVDFSMGNMSNYCGPLVSEKIIENSVLVELTNLLRLPWRGISWSLSLPSGGYMVGSSHSEQAHSNLTLERVQYQIKRQ